MTSAKDRLRHTLKQLSSKINVLDSKIVFNAPDITVYEIQFECLESIQKYYIRASDFKLSENWPTYCSKIREKFSEWLPTASDGECLDCTML